MYHGMMTIYKEAGYTSSDAVARLRGILHMRKIGHTGTLDPDAEGVLPMCLGNATRVCELIADKEKEYTAVMRLGVRTDTQDMSGNILTRMEPEEILRCLLGQEPEEDALQGACGPSPEASLSGKGDPSSPDTALRGVCGPEEYARQRICAAAASFTGEIDQIPPMYSAIKVNGKRLYDLARKGKTVERRPRRITIHSLEVEKVDLPLVTLRVCCSRGTYIRTLCEDIGNALGTGAAMESLLRTRVGRFTLDEAFTLDEVEHFAKTEPEKLKDLIRPVDSLFAELPAARCSAGALRLLKNGNPLEEGELLHLTGREDPLKKNSREELSSPEERGDRRSGPGQRAEGTISGHSVSPVSNSAGFPGLSGTEKDPGQETFPASVSDTSAVREEAVDKTVFFPGTGPGDCVLRMYDEADRFYGLYKKAKGRSRYTALKMFLPEEGN